MNAGPSERLQRALAECVEVPESRHSQVGRLAARHAAAERPRGIRVKEAVLAEPVDDSKFSGEFVALISDFEPDRHGERFDRHAFDSALSKIRKAGRPIPVLVGTTATRSAPCWAWSRPAGCRSTSVDFGRGAGST